MSIHPSSADQNTAESIDGSTGRDYFPLAPLILISALWWEAVMNSHFSGALWESSATAMAIAACFALYRWLCGPGKRVTLLTVAMTAVLALAWRSEAVYNSISLLTFSLLLFIPWLILKFKDRVHSEDDDEEEEEENYHSLLKYDDADPSRPCDPDSFGMYPLMRRRRVISTGRVWTSVLTEFQPRAPASWSKQKIRLLCALLMILGAAIFFLGYRHLTYGTLSLVWIQVDLLPAALAIMGAGWSVSGISFELMRAKPHKSSATPHLISDRRKEPIL